MYLRTWDHRISEQSPAASIFEATYSPEGGFERRVAVKRVLPAYSSDRSFLELFRREAEVGAQLAHPNLVPVHALGIDASGAPVLVMKLVEGVSWRTLLADHLRLMLVLDAPLLAGMLAENYHSDVINTIKNNDFTYRAGRLTSK